MNVIKRLLVCLALSLAVAVGCGGPANEYDSTVTGTVTIDGDLAPSGTVKFQPVENSGKIAIGRIHPDGSYSLRTGQGDLQQVDGGTVVSGDYIVTVSITAPPADDSHLKTGGPPIPGPSLVATKYATIETSDLKYAVKPGPQVIVLELARAEAMPATEETTVDGAEVQPEGAPQGAEEAAGAAASTEVQSEQSIPQGSPASPDDTGTVGDESKVQ